ncbi:MAG: UDP-N-acetylmuramoylalanyl-D-glutamate--2,6-diaminopimelate ligase [Peptococcaceae bacterium BRH_c4a]|nr:MAG: UDP-N-acetylmuramoylalanyl-D-glutamate--2,6-diaminopimelate ligase [Peptococcaceae bacterium BRH_c4a]
MFPLNIMQIAGAISGQIVNHGEDRVFRTVSIDSRKVKQGDLFFALRGDRFDGHDFVPRTLEAGALGVVLEREVGLIPPEIPVLMVEDTQAALQDLARYNRKLSAAPVIGVTGSSGKTSTKDLLYSVLSAKFHTLKTEGNFNNELGLPLTLLRLDERHQAAVVEMAMRGQGELDFLGRIALPNGAVITNIGEAHFEILGSVDNIARAKGEILDYIGEGGFAVLHGDSPYMQREALRCQGKVVFYGEDQGLDLWVRDIAPVDGGNRFTAVHRDRETEYFVPLPGRHNVINSLAAIAVGLELGMEEGDIRAGLSGANLTAMRLEISRFDGITVIDDSYNANPSSAKAAIQALAETAGENSRKIAVLGDMLELGDKSEPGHREVGRAAREAGVDLLVPVGERARHIGAGASEAGMSPQQIHYFTSPREAAWSLKNIIRPSDVILVKGSRGMKMEEFILALRENAWQKA